MHLFSHQIGFIVAVCLVTGCSRLPVQEVIDDSVPLKGLILEKYKEVPQEDGSVLHYTTERYEYDSQWRITYQERTLMFQKSSGPTVYEGNVGTTYLVNESTDPLDLIFAGEEPGSSLILGRDTLIVIYADETCKRELTRIQKVAQSRTETSYDEQGRISHIELYYNDELAMWRDFTYEGTVETETLTNLNGINGKVTNRYVTTYNPDLRIPIRQEMYMNGELNHYTEYSASKARIIRADKYWADGTLDHTTEYTWNGLLCEYSLKMLSNVTEQWEETEHGFILYAK